MKRKFKIYFNAPITLAFVLMCFIALLLQKLTNGASTRLLFSTYKASLLDPLMYIRLVGHVFGHINLEHFLSNMMYILLLGPMLEEKYRDKLIIVVLVTAIITGIINNVFFSVQLLGASGIVFAFILLASITGKEKGIPITLILVAIFFIGSEINDALTLNDSISQLTHIIGGCCGAIVGLYYKK